MTTVNITFQSNLDKLNRAAALYLRASRKTPAEVVKKLGVDLGYKLTAELKALAPAKGSVRQSRLAALKAGGGLLVRAAAREFADKHTVATAMKVARSISNQNAKRLA